MKNIKNCEILNCIETPSSCTVWNGGDIPFLGICDGDSLNNVVLETVIKLQAISGDDLSSFDIDTLLTICNQAAPFEISLISILNILKNNDICLKDYIDTLIERVNELATTKKVNVNLKCFADIDNLGNALDITRDELDQLVINILCDHEQDIDTLNGKVINLQEQINNISLITTVEELAFATCIDATVKPTSEQVKSIATDLCALESATGNPSDISSALANTPAIFATEFSLLPGWINTPANWAESYSNLLLVVGNNSACIKFIKENCCAATCDDVKLGFSAIFNEDMDGIIIKFNSGTGTVIPSGFTDKGSTGSITDIDGNIATFALIITNNYEVEVSISGLNLNGDLDINITAKIGTDNLTCEKCLYKKVKPTGCGYCEITASGDSTAYVVIAYEDESTVAGGYVFPTTTTTTAAPTTTTTTAAP